MLTRRRFLLACGSLAAAGAGVGAFGHFVEAQHIEFTTHRVPRGWPSFAHLTDLHLHHVQPMHEVIANEIARRKCAFIVITGDSIDRRGNLPLLNDVLAMLPPIPKFAILGNWEYFAKVDTHALTRVYERWNGRLLVNQSVEYEGLRLIGLDDFVAGKPDISRAMSTPSTSDARLLLVHCPGYRDAIQQHDTFDLMLSGHTHGGQICPLGFVPYTPKGSGRYIAGWYDGGSPMYVSRGVGTTAVSIRWQCRPEVAFFQPEA